MTVVRINTCMVTSLCYTICVCHLISQVCVTIHSITPLLFYHSPRFSVCVALSSGIHTLFVGVDALVLASVPLIWGTPCLPSTTACVCVVMAFLHCPGPVNHLPPFLCVFWCVPQATASICTDRGGYALWCRLPQK